MYLVGIIFLSFRLTLVTKAVLKGCHRPPLEFLRPASHHSTAHSKADYPQPLKPLTTLLLTLFTLIKIIISDTITKVLNIVPYTRPLLKRILARHTLLAIKTRLTRRILAPRTRLVIKSHPTRRILAPRTCLAIKTRRTRL